MFEENSPYGQEAPVEAPVKYVGLKPILPLISPKSNERMKQEFLKRYLTERYLTERRLPSLEKTNSLNTYLKTHK